MRRKWAQRRRRSANWRPLWNGCRFISTVIPPARKGSSSWWNRRPAKNRSGVGLISRCFGLTPGGTRISIVIRAFIIQRALIFGRAVPVAPTAGKARPRISAIGDMTRRFYRTGGFTLVELMVVVVIIGIITAVIIP